MNNNSEVGKYGRVLIIAGMQYGSEGKGAIASYLAPIVSMGVRSGAANAGHTIYYGGRKYIMRQIPSVWINPYAQLVIGISSLVSIDILLNEIKMVENILGETLEGRLFIDQKAHVIQEDQIRRESKSGLAERIGSTSAMAGEGIGVAMADKVLRKASCLQVKDVKVLRPYIADTVDMINDCLDQDQIVLLEGTQGFGLSLEHGEFPYVTSRDTTPAALAASVGISAHHFDIDVIGVARTYPIRVAGNSGPFGGGSQEITWEELTKISGANMPLSEKTSVTGKIRRVATFNWQDFEKACQVVRPTELALTFADYLDWCVHEEGKLSIEIERFIENMEKISNVPVTLVKTGAQTTIDFDHYRRSILRRV